MDVMTWIRQEHGGLRPRLHDWFVSEIPLDRFTERPGGLGCSAAWLVLHTSVHQDTAVNVAARGVAPVAAEHWANLGLGDLHWSTPLNEPDLLDSYPTVDVNAVLAYADAVNATTATWLNDLRAEELDAVPPTAERLTAAGVVDPAVAWVAQRWADKPVSWLVQWEAIGHTLLHQGELAALRGRLDLRSQRLGVAVPDGRFGNSVIAVDWSGSADDRGLTMWLAHCVDGELVELRNGWRRAEVAERILTLAADNPGSVVGLDFAFAFPQWFADTRGWSNAVEMWTDVRSSGEGWLRDGPLPFWGRPGRKRGAEEQFRATEREVAQRWSVQPKSTFQIGGAGAVGTGSVRGMPHLLTLADAGCAIWPFEGQSGNMPLATVVEIYPRLLTGPVVKGRREAREQALAGMSGPGASRTHRDLVDLAAVSEDAFDAAVSAFRMHAYLSESGGLPSDTATIEGRIWEPQ